MFFLKLIMVLFLTAMACVGTLIASGFWDEGTWGSKAMAVLALMISGGLLFFMYILIKL